MSASQKTTHYNLPIYAGTDVTGWLSGFNPAMQAIDAALFNINQAAEDANGTAAGAEASAQQAITSAQATANLVVQLSNTVTELVNKTIFHRVLFTEAAGVSCGGVTNKDGSFSSILIGVYGKQNIASSYTVNGIAFHELGNCDEKLCSRVLSGSTNNGFTGAPLGIGYIPLKIGEENSSNGIGCFYDNNAKKTRFGITTALQVRINDSNSSCANISFTGMDI